MYAVIATGGKQYRVAEGDTVDVERLGVDEGGNVDLVPVLLVDDGTVLATPEQLSGASVTGRVLGRSAGPKVTGFTYKNKSNNRRRWGHRQSYDRVEIIGITKG